MVQKHIFVGFITYHGDSLNDLITFKGYVCVKDGVITDIGTKDDFEIYMKYGKFGDYEIKYLDNNQFLMPGFIDCHTHAPQFPNISLGLDRPLLEWLDKYTFPLECKYEDLDFAKKVYAGVVWLDKYTFPIECKYEDLDFAKKVYAGVVQRLLQNGTTTACYFGSLHKEGSLELVKSAIKYKQRALVGKVSMNLENGAGYYNDTETEIKQTEDFIIKVLEYKNNLVQPIVTPRFAVSCDTELMCALSDIAQRYNCRIQSHVSENTKEIEYVLSQFPGCATYSDVYDKCGILTNKCIMAHGVFLTQDEMRVFANKGVSVAHCPASNTRLRSGLCPVRRLLDNNVNVGLGTDVSGGDSASILDAIRRAMDVSTHLELQGRCGPALDWKEAFYLATLGGAIALNLDDKVGNFVVGKEFDALLIDIHKGQIDDFEYPEVSDDEHIINLLQKFLYVGDDRNIVQVYVKGNLVKDIL